MLIGGVCALSGISMWKMIRQTVTNKNEEKSNSPAVTVDEFTRVCDIPATYESFMAAYQKKKEKGLDVKYKVPAKLSHSVYDVLRIEPDIEKRAQLTKILEQEGFFRSY